MSTNSDPDFAARPQLADDVGAVRPQANLRRHRFRLASTCGSTSSRRELGISVTPVREALLNLRAEGLLELLPRRGFMVLEVTARDVADVANVQAFIGGELAARAAENITDEQLSELRTIQDELEEAYGSNDLDRMVRLNHEFHRLINVAADSAEADPVHVGHHAVRARSRSSRRCPAGRSSRPGTTVASSPRSQQRDAALARTAMAEHFTVGVAPLTEHLVERGVIRAR